MPSLRHEATVELLRDHPSLLVDLLRERLHLPLRTRVVVADANEKLIPAEVRADLVLALRAGRRRVRFIVEVQLSRNWRKRRVWPSYLYEQWRRFGGEVYLVVIALDEAVARWAAQPIVTGQAGTVFRVEVIGPAHLPRIVDAEEAARTPELAVLSVFARRDDAEAALAAVRGASLSLEPLRAEAYSLFLRNVLTANARRIVEATMRASVMKRFKLVRSPWELDLIDKGRVEGEAKGKASALLRLLAARELKVSLARRRLVERCTDLQQLDEWFDRALTATSTRAVFAKQ